MGLFCNVEIDRRFVSLEDLCKKLEMKIDPYYMNFWANCSWRLR